jgi:serine/threonine-protein kinase
MLPGGNGVLFVAATGDGADAWDKGQIVVFRLDPGERTVIHTGAADPRYVATGHIVYAIENTLFAVPFDTDALQVRGGPVPVVPEVRRAIGANIGIAQYALSDNGTLVYLKGAADAQVSLSLADRNGSRKQLPGSTALVYHPRFNHDDSRIAVHRVDDVNPNVWIYEVSQAQWRQLTFGGGDRPEWTPDGRAITYRNGTSLWQIPSDFSGAAEQLPGTDAPGNLGPFDWSADGEVLLYGAMDGLRAFRPKAASLDAAGKDALLLKPPDGATSISRANFSPDGRWFVYTPLFPGESLVYVSPFPVSAGGQRKIMNETASSPIWKRDEIFVNSAGVLRALGIKTQPALDWANPTTLFGIQGVAAPTQGSTNYDVTRDGKQILEVVLTETGDTASQEIQIVLNWHEELKRLAPVP